jgi:hypothetical protein
MPIFIISWTSLLPHYGSLLCLLTITSVVFYHLCNSILDNGVQSRSKKRWNQKVEITVGAGEIQQRMDGPNNERQLFSRIRNVYVADLDCLQNETWLYEHVIMMFLDFEHQHHENILLLDFEMYNCWLQRTLQLGVSYDHLDVMSEFVVFNTQIYQFVMWIVPIHENNHYQLLIIVEIYLL